MTNPQLEGAGEERQRVTLARLAGGAENTRALLFSVLGELVLPSGGEAWTSSFIDVLARNGVEEKTTRQTLARTARDGWLTPERQGRRTLWRLSPGAIRLLTEGRERIYGFTPTLADWDGRWALALVRSGDLPRGARDDLRRRLSWAGFASPWTGAWISPHAARAAEAEAMLISAGVGEAQVFVAEHRGATSVAAMVDAAWDRAAIELGYRDFAERFRHSPANADALQRVVELVHRWRRFPAVDPGLPAELLPAGWPGDEARALFVRHHASWAADALAEWARITH